MSLINSLGKHPASNTSCLDGEAPTSLASIPGCPLPCSLLTHSPRSPAGARPGLAWLWVLVDYIPRGAVLLQLALGCFILALLGDKSFFLAASQGTAHTTAACIPTKSQALLCWHTAFPWEGCFLFHGCCVWDPMGHAELEKVSAEPSKRALAQGEIMEE